MDRVKKLRTASATVAAIVAVAMAALQCVLLLVYARCSLGCPSARILGLHSYTVPAVVDVAMWCFIVHAGGSDGVARPACCPAAFITTLLTGLLLPSSVLLPQLHRCCV